LDLINCLPTYLHLPSIIYTTTPPIQQAATNRGLRTHLFINVPPEERAPGSIGSATKAALLKEHITEFNTVLAAHVSAFQAANPGQFLSTA
jgi:hypothetical protein